MGYQHRERKRRARLAQSSSRREQRSKYPDRHYLTIVSRACCCNHGGERLREGDGCVFRFQPKEILCLNCATVLGIKYRPSMRWERQKSDGSRPQTRG